MKGQPTSQTEQSNAQLVVAITARALFHLEDGHQLFEAQGIEAYSKYQIDRENELLNPALPFLWLKNYWHSMWVRQ